MGTIMENGWKADLSPALKDHKKSNQSKQMDKRLVFAMRSLIRYPYV
ncbi:hypothetical protein [Bacillus cereus]|nr:hypothetical protein [Bacillus cereus]